MELVAAPAGVLGDFFPFRIEDFVAVAVAPEGAIRAVKNYERELLLGARMATAVVATGSAFPEIEDRSASVGSFLIILEIIAAAVESHPARLFHLQPPACNVQAMKAR